MDSFNSHQVCCLTSQTTQQAVSSVYKAINDKSSSACSVDAMCAPALDRARILDSPREVHNMRESRVHLLCPRPIKCIHMPYAAHAYICAWCACAHQLLKTVVQAQIPNRPRGRQTSTFIRPRARQTARLAQILAARLGLRSRRCPRCCCARARTRNWPSCFKSSRPRRTSRR